MHTTARSAFIRILLVLGVLSAQLDQALIRSWGSFSTTPTHQNICRLAYDQLKADPAFDPTKFPSLAEILSNEGVSWEGAGESVTTPSTWLTGPGPDSEGVTNYREHYYNPRLPEGGAPTSIAQNYVWLAKGIFTGTKTAHTKAAAWGAHFLADLFVPYHVNGALKTTVQAEYNAQGGASASAISLRPEISGPLDLCYGCVSNPHDGNFKTEVERGLAVSAPHVDWVDPWYYNGNWPATAKSSSHMVWEGTISGPSSYSLSGYDPAWKNAAPTFVDPWTAQSASAAHMAEKAAAETASLVGSYYLNAEPALARAVQSVFTLWRAAISALKPEFEAAPVEGEEGVHEVRATVENVAGEAATGVQMQITVEGGSVVDGANPQRVGDAPARSKSPVAKWKIKTADPTKCRIKLEVCGSYAQTPDLQYAAVNEPLPGPVGPLDLCFCIDLTGSMADDIGKVKASVAAIINTIAGKTKDFRVAVLGYRDWPDEKSSAPQPPMFQDYAFSADRDAIIANINALTVDGGGDEPEAVLEALMRAIKGQGIGAWRNNVNKQIILMGDAPPHDPSQAGLTAAIVAKAAEDADPIVIQAIAIGNAGSMNSQAVESFGNLARMTGGKFFQAADADAVPKAIMASIRALPPAPTAEEGFWSKYKWYFLIGGGALFLLLFLVLVIALVRRGRRRRGAANAPAYPYPAPDGRFSPPTWPPAGPPVQSGYRPAPPPPGYPAPPPARPPQGGYPFASCPPPPTVPPGPAYPGHLPPPPSPEPGGRCWLEVVSGPLAGQQFFLGHQARIGRLPDNDIILADAKLSGHHAVVARLGDVFMITDLNSTNGTTVNGRRINESVMLQEGWVVGLGELQLVFHSAW